MCVMISWTPSNGGSAIPITSSARILHVEETILYCLDQSRVNVLLTVLVVNPDGPPMPRSPGILRRQTLRLLRVPVGTAPPKERSKEATIH